jgi:RNA polymerase sigma-70 factor, ECF subfamily
VERILVRLLGHTDPEVEDVLHESFAHCFANLAKLSDPDRLKGWVAQIAVTTARMTIRKRRRRRWLSYLAPWQVPERASPSVDHAGRQLAERLYQVLDRLPSDERIAFALHVVDEMTLAETAEATGVSIATLKRRLARAREAVRRAIEADPAFFDAEEER